MAEFETGAELSLTVPNRELAGVRTQIEDELADISVGVDADMAGGGGGRGGVQNQLQPRDPDSGQFMAIEGVEQRVIEHAAITEDVRDIQRQGIEHLEDSAVYLESIEDELTSGDALGGGGGGGGGTTILGGLGIGGGGALAGGGGVAGLVGAGVLGIQAAAFDTRREAQQPGVGVDEEEIVRELESIDAPDLNLGLDDDLESVREFGSELSGLSAPELGFGLDGAAELLGSIDDRLGGLAAPDIGLGLDGAMDTVARLDERLSGLGDSITGGGAEPQYVPSEGMVTPDTGGMDLSIDLDDIDIGVDVSVSGAIDIAGDVEQAVRDAVGPPVEQVEQDLRDRIDDVESQVERGLRNGRGR